MHKLPYLDYCSPYQYSEKQPSVVDLSSARGLHPNIFSKNCKAGTIVMEEQSNKTQLCTEEASSPLLGASK